MAHETQRQASLESPVFGQLEQWLAKRIRDLSIDALASKAFTCTACGEVEGEYLVDYEGKTYRFDTATTYAFLEFILAKQPTIVH
ncbi:hypothetical protein N836_12445 [Leptolyngbya sp. Heron Island J]|uniref:hypothetical protein n=1 Tax=Leptolyngbya sp. Heron Island J TaxID=1385935 RepID=UPI0003B98E8B|nr:hypothetical protein [Leptolyngbya sp. Heron Island J]ESA35509.1 hypothetical protein N836_12445 [Leptolyngbya sp. Heron Island J]